MPRPIAILRAGVRSLAWLLAGGLAAGGCLAQPAPPKGEVKGSAWSHTAESVQAAVQRADVVLPAQASGGAPWVGKWSNLPPTQGRRVPVVIFLHGSSGLSKAIADWQLWLATLGIASVAPDSFALPGRVTYTSPIDVASYERIHQLRASEIAPALAAVRAQPWADASRLVLAGTSEGSVPVARWAGTEFAARILYAWSCEANYFVEAPRNAFAGAPAVLNVISASDPYFSHANAWLGNEQAKGHCGAALRDDPNAAVVLVPDAPHTLLHLPAARDATAGFLWRALHLGPDAGAAVR
jgi:dienelactone hydrolase